MAFEPNRILHQNIIDAVAKIENENIVLNPSTGYDVIINGKAYPPKEIIRISHQLATGNEPGIIYGGKQVNNILSSLGFEIKKKASVWKLGCHWETGNPSFYEFIKTEKIVIGVQSLLYTIGDIVLITEGFTVYAIAKVLSKPRPVTENDLFKEKIKYYNIPFDDNITYAEADWYELPKTEVFIYQLQQGIRRVRKLDIIEKTIDIFENRNNQTLDFLFYAPPEYVPEKVYQYPCFFFSQDQWNDYGYQTSFDLTFYKTAKEKVRIGTVKILEGEKLVTKLPLEFKSLDSTFCSLGQTLDYYRRLQEEFPKMFKKILKNLGDCAFNFSKKKQFENYQGFKVSLLRSTEGLLALNEAKNLFTGISGDNFNYDFIFKCKIGDALELHSVDFSFNMDEQLPNRIFCLIGKNGTGKTKFISQLANKLTNNGEPGECIPSRPTFSKIIAVSFSFFDNFKLPEFEDTSYEFIGIKTRRGVLSENAIIDIVYNSFLKISQDKEKKDLWVESIKSSLESELLSFDIDQLNEIENKSVFSKKTEDIFSSGQKIIFHFLTRLISILADNSLIIFDEPETHLHPNIAGRLIRTLNKILVRRKSYCIISTHSPIIVQEMPSKYIRIFDRQENFPNIFEPPIECLGENLSIISNTIFHVDQENTLYKETFLKLKREFSLQEIEMILGRPLSLNASLLIQSLNF